MSRVVMYIFINKGLGMSSGKIAAQASHAAVEAFRISKQHLIEKWYEGGHYTKLVMQAADAENLRAIERYLDVRGVKTAMIIDEGRTEIAPHQLTALGCEIVDKDENDIEAIFSSFSLYKDTVRVNLEVDR
jgi:PTH2 family peptidyl-tRNA hydrolase